MGQPAQIIDRAGEVELARLRLERTLEDVDLLVTTRCVMPSRVDEELQLLLAHYEELRWHTLALAI